MDKYNIGIVDENEKEVLDIQRTIIANKPDKVQEDHISFEIFELNSEPELLIESLYEIIKESIANNKLDSILIDYKIIVSNSIVEGSDLFRMIKENILKFPAILLTNVKDACYEKSFVDADKVYSKQDFFKIEDIPSQEKVLNLFRNMDKYRENKSQLMTLLAEAMGKYKDGWNQTVYEKVIKIDNELDDYLPQDKTRIERGLKLTELREAVQLIQEASRLIGENNENQGF